MLQKKVLFPHDLVGEMSCLSRRRSVCGEKPQVGWVLVQHKRMQKIPHNARQSPGVSGRDDPDSAVIRRKMILLLFYTFSNRMYCFFGRRRNALRSIFTVSGCRKIKNHANTLLNGTSSGCFSATARKNSAPSPEYAPVIIAIFIHALLLYPSCFGHL